MKRIYMLICITVLCLLLCSCTFFHRNYTELALESAGITDFVETDAERDEKNYNYYAYKMTEEEFADYVQQVYDFYLAQNYAYFGTEGEVVESFFGAFPTYELEPTSCAEDHHLVRASSDGYFFVGANRISDDGTLVNELCISLYYNEDKDYPVCVYADYGKKNSSFRLKDFGKKALDGEEISRLFAIPENCFMSGTYNSEVSQPFGKTLYYGTEKVIFAEGLVQSVSEHFTENIYSREYLAGVLAGEGKELTEENIDTYLASLSGDIILKEEESYHVIYGETDTKIYRNDEGSETDLLYNYSENNKGFRRIRVPGGQNISFVEMLLKNISGKKFTGEILSNQDDMFVFSDEYLSLISDSTDTGNSYTEIRFSESEGKLTKLVIGLSSREAADSRNMKYEYVITYGEQAVELPAEEELIICDHVYETDFRLHVKCLDNGETESYHYTCCEKCGDVNLMERCTQDESGCCSVCGR